MIIKNATGRELHSMYRDSASEALGIRIPDWDNLQHIERVAWVRLADKLAQHYAPPDGDCANIEFPEDLESYPVKHAKDCNVRTSARIGPSDSLQCDCGFVATGELEHGK
jgi:hypothetical protein